MARARLELVGVAIVVALMRRLERAHVELRTRRLGVE